MVRQSKSRGGSERETETKNPKHAPGIELTAQNPSQGSKLNGPSHRGTLLNPLSDSNALGPCFEFLSHSSCLSPSFIASVWG